MKNEAVKYTLASGVAFFVDFTGLFFFSEFFGIHYLISAFFSFLLGMLTIYYLSIIWVFEHRAFPQRKIELPIFLLIGIVGLIINQIGMYFITEFADVFYMISKIIVTVIVFAWNFLARKVFLFTKKVND